MKKQYYDNKNIIKILYGGGATGYKIIPLKILEQLVKRNKRTDYEGKPDGLFTNINNDIAE